MRTDVVLRNEGLEILSKHLGLVEAERFLILMQKEKFDYTDWQKDLFQSMTIEEISSKAAEYRRKKMKK